MNQVRAGRPGLPRHVAPAAMTLAAQAAVGVRSQPSTSVIDAVWTTTSGRALDERRGDARRVGQVQLRYW